MTAFLPTTQLGSPHLKLDILSPNPLLLHSPAVRYPGRGCHCQTRIRLPFKKLVAHKDHYGLSRCLPQNRQAIFY